MDSAAFVAELETWKNTQLATVFASGRASLTDDTPADAQKLLQIALANEISVSELAALWMPTTPELDVKLAFARQAGDEAGHFQLVGERLAALGASPGFAGARSTAERCAAWIDASAFQPPAPGDNPLFAYMKSLATTVERVAAGLFTLESIAYGVNENFIAFCAQRGDSETVRIYREYIQPDERAHQELGQRLLAKYVITGPLRATARETVAKVLEIAGATRAKAAERLGTACFPGC